VGRGGGWCEHEEHNGCELQSGILYLVVERSCMDLISMLMIYGVDCVVFSKNFELIFMDLMIICLFAPMACLLWIVGFLHYRLLVGNTWVGAN
jgi:hypothetical protein